MPQVVIHQLHKQILERGQVNGHVFSERVDPKGSASFATASTQYCKRLRFCKDAITATRKYIIALASSARLGDDAEPFEAQLVNKNETHEWLRRPVAGSSYDQVVNLTNQGFKQKEIAEKLNIDKSNVCRHLKRANQEGRVTASASPL